MVVKTVKIDIPKHGFCREIYEKYFREPCDVHRIAVTLLHDGTLQLFLLDKKGKILIDSEQILKLELNNKRGN